uniref:Pentatricopeptide repeat-containing protein n=1 Tax=Aegilops tauschii subsp. strangulata TaxID=200361 RepID=A0A453N2Q7_AEGTS
MLATRVYVDMLHNDVEPDGYTFPFVVKACAQLAALRQRRQLQGHAVKLGFLEHDEHAQNSLISFYGKCGEPELARRAFEQMEARERTGGVLERAARGVHEGRAMGGLSQLVRRDGAEWVEARRELNGERALSMRVPGHLRRRPERPLLAAEEYRDAEYVHGDVPSGHVPQMRLHREGDGGVRRHGGQEERVDVHRHGVRLGVARGRAYGAAGVRRDDQGGTPT